VCVCLSSHAPTAFLAEILNPTPNPQPSYNNNYGPTASIPQNLYLNPET